MLQLRLLYLQLKSNIMSDDIFQGYKGKALELLKKYKVRVWGKCEVETTRGKF